MSHNPAVAYRSDIDGLRAIAVLAVVFYHFGIGGISGGFVGVDVFFVISGFLITGIIHREVGQGKFTFADFYERRIRRIFPALILVLVVTMVAGVLILLPTDLELLGKSTIATLFFSSNIFFWRTIDYFSPNSDLNLLLHMWSLAVEEQFYIGLPLLLIILERYARNHLKLLLFICAALSFAACIWVQESRPTASFYLSPFRAWELLFGSLIAVGFIPALTKLWVREWVSWAGLFLILLSIAVIETSSDFPGWQAMVPVMGTVMLIHSGSSGKSTVTRLLGFRPIVFVGLISYSLYLWHWPVVVYLKYLNGLDELRGLAWIGLALSLLLAIATYYLLETPLRVNKRLFTKTRLFYGTVLLTLLTIFVSLVFWMSSGLPSRFSKELIAIDAERNQQEPYSNCDLGGYVLDEVMLNSECRLGNKINTPSVMLWGDSHAISIAPAFHEILEEKELTGVIVPNSSCLGLLGVKVANDPQCLSDNDDVIKFIHNNSYIDTVVLHSNWGAYTGKYTWKISNRNGQHGKYIFSLALLETVARLNELGKKVIVIGQVPTSSTTPDETAIRTRFGMTLRKPLLYSEYQENNHDFATAMLKVKPKASFSYIDLSKYFCNESECKHIEGNKSLYRDSQHLGSNGTQYIVPFLMKDFYMAEAAK